jgi:hypothetical protein
VQWVDYDNYVGWAPRRPHYRSWDEPWIDNNVHHWLVVRKGDFNRENINSYRVPSVTRSGNVSQNPIQRHQPDVMTIQRYFKDPIQVMKFEKEPVVTQIKPVRTNTSPERNVPPERVIPPLDRTPLPPGRTNPPQERTNTLPERTNTPPGSKKITTTTQTPGNRPLIRMQVPTTEKQKVDKYRSKVEKEVLVKKTPRTQKVD